MNRNMNAFGANMNAFGANMNAAYGAPGFPAPMQPTEPVEVLRNLSLPAEFGTINRDLVQLALTDAPNRIPSDVARRLDQAGFRIGDNYDSSVLILYGDVVLNMVFATILKNTLGLSVKREAIDAIRGGLGPTINRYLKLTNDSDFCRRIEPISHMVNASASMQGFSTPGPAFMGVAPEQQVVNMSPQTPGGASPAQAAGGQLVPQGTYGAPGQYATPGMYPMSSFQCDSTLSAILGALFVQFGETHMPSITKWVSERIPITQMVQDLRYSPTGANFSQGVGLQSMYTGYSSGMTVASVAAASAAAAAAAAAAGGATLINASTMTSSGSGKRKISLPLLTYNTTPSIAQVTQDLQTYVQIGLGEQGGKYVLYNITTGNKVSGLPEYDGKLATAEDGAALIQFLIDKDVIGVQTRAV